MIGRISARSCAKRAGMSEVVKKTIQVALREFLATVVTKGFLIGIILFPLLMTVSGLGVSMMIRNDKPPKIRGEIAVIDPTGEVVERLREYLRPEAMARRIEEAQRRVSDETAKEVGQLTKSLASAASQEALKMFLGEVPDLAVRQLDSNADLEIAKEALTTGANPDYTSRLALAVIHEDAVVPKEGQQNFGTYDLFVREKLDDRIEREIKNGLRDSIVGARIRLQDMDRDYIESLIRLEPVTSKTVTKTGEQDTKMALNTFLPLGFLLLLFIAVMGSGQNILTTTVEEKSSRVVEVLLSAVSPTELMAGKIIGQMCVGFVMLAVYAGIGIYALAIFALIGALQLHLIVYMLIFFLIAYFIIGSLMAAIGSAVNDMREAQALMTPVMLVQILPWILWLPISRNPDSLFSIVLSFLPPINCFVMLLRMTSSTPPPWWQVGISIALGLAAAYGALLFAGKVFRVGLLMFGKPPDFRTLIRWVRMA
jgi:ABC-2 type transport system permease protein